MAKSRTDFQKDLDGELTAYFNQIEAYQKFLARHVARLTQKLNATSYKQHVKFFVKGGTALKLLKMKLNIADTSAWSDWDTELIINPNLSLKEWYQIFLEVQKLLIVHIIEMQIEWESLVHTPALSPLTLKTTYNIDLSTQFNSIIMLGTPVLHPMQTLDNARTVINNKPETLTVEDYVDQLFEFNQLSRGLYEIKSTEYDSFDVSIRTQMEGVFNFMSPIMKGGVEYKRFLAADHDVNRVETLLLSLADTTTISADDSLKLAQAFRNVMKTPKDFSNSTMLINTVIEDFLLYRMLVRYSLPKYLLNGKATGDTNHTVALRGELLDISIPRRDTEEAFNQWQQVGLQELKNTDLGSLNWGNTDIIRVPDWRYHVQENILLILEVVEGRSSSPHKVQKRIDRGSDAIDRLSGLVKLDNDIKTPLRAATMTNGTSFYDQFLTEINTNQPANFRKNLLILWLLASLEENFVLSEYLPEGGAANLKDALSLLDTKINSAFGKVKNSIPELYKGSTDIDKVKDVFNKVTNEQKELIGLVQLTKDLSLQFKRAYSQSEMRALGQASQILTQNQVEHALDSVFSSIYLINHMQKTRTDDTFIHPYFEIFLPGYLDAALKKNIETAFTKLTERGFTANNNNPAVDKKNQYIFTKGTVRIKLLHFDDFRLYDVQQLDGVSIWKNNKIIHVLNRQIALSTNPNIIHWLDTLRKNFQEALSTF